MAIDSKHLPEDPKTLQQMVLDLMTQLDREFTERNKIEVPLRELLDARRNRKSEQLSADRLALFAAAWQERQGTDATGDRNDDDQDHPRPGGSGGAGDQKRRTGGGRQPLAKHLKRERIVHDLAIRKGTAPPAGRICGPSVKNPASATNTSRRN